MKHSRLTDDLQEQASLYAAGAMTESERREYARHLEDDGCEVCRAEVHELQATMSMVALTAPAADPSPVVRQRLMAQARVSAARPEVDSGKPFLRRHWFDFIAGAAAIGGILVALLVNSEVRELRRQTVELQDQISKLEVQLSQSRILFAKLIAPEVRVVDLAGQGQNAQASGRIFWDQKQKHLYFFAKDLPRVPADKAYELWFVPKAGNPVRAIVFNTESNGSIEFDIGVPEGIDIGAAAVTTEPAGGTDAPTGAFALLGSM